MRSRSRYLRCWLGPIGGLACLAVLLPPVATLARHYVFVQTLQFALLGYVVPAFLMVGRPWRLPGVPAALSDLAARLATRRSHRTGTRRAWLTMLSFLALTLAWRLPVLVNAMVRHPVLTVAEAVTLIVAGCRLWCELIEAQPFLPRVTRPVRAVFAALPMWAIWASAYIMAFSQATWFTAIERQPGQGLGVIADQQLAAGLLWAISGLCFVPVVYFALITWLGDSSYPDDELRQPSFPAGSAELGLPRSPRGWRTPSA